MHVKVCSSTCLVFSWLDGNIMQTARHLKLPAERDRLFKENLPELNGAAYVKAKEASYPPVANETIYLR